MAVISLGGNIASLKALRALGDASGKVSSSAERLSSGLRINHAADDAAGISIASELGIASRVYTQGIRNVNDAISMLSIADGATSALTEIVTRIKELAEQSANGVLSSRQRTSLDSEAQALRDEYNRIISSTKFNGIAVLDGLNNTVTIQSGFGNEGSLGIDLNSSLLRPMASGTFTDFGDATFSATIRSLTAGDLNGDGKTDVIASLGNKHYSYLSNGDGTFRVPYSSTIAFSSSIYNTALYDVNGDSALDIICATDSGVNVRLGNGDGSFQAQSVQRVSGVQFSSASTGDFNNDGIVDIRAKEVNSGTNWYLFFGNGNGTFNAGVSLPITAGAQAGDLNEDGILDLMVSSGSGSPLGVQIGNGDGTFRAFVTLATTGADEGLSKIVDLNGDGHLDLLTDGNYFRVRLGNGDGTFRVSTSSSASGAVIGVSVADVNEDSNLDIVTVTGTSLDVLLGNGDGRFSAARSVTSAGGFSDLAIGDFRGIGVIDAMAGLTTNMSVLLGDYTQAPTLSRFSLLTASDARTTLSTMTTALGRLATHGAVLGATMSRLDSTVANLGTTVVNYDATRSRILDADVAEEVAEQTRSRIVQQSAAAVLAQANTQPALALQLLRVQ